MPYKCSNCDKEFLLKSRFRGHLRRKTKCTTQSSMDAFKKLVDVIEARVCSLPPGEVEKEQLLYFDNRLTDLVLFYHNLPDTDQSVAKVMYEERLKPFFLNKLSVLF